MRIWPCFIAALVGFIVASSAQSVSAAPPLRAPLLKAAVQSKIDADVGAPLNEAHTQGATIAVIQNGATVYTRGYAYAM